MARIWRDGQLKPVVIYRLLATGTIEERIYQRQLGKIGLSDGVIDDKGGRDGFSKKELRDLFTFHSGTDCLTLDLMQDGCAQLEGWDLVDEPQGCSDRVLAGVWEEKLVSFAFVKYNR